MAHDQASPASARENMNVETVKSEAPLNERRFNPSASIVLVGSQYVGKRTLGFMGIQHLGRRLVCEEYFFEKQNGMHRNEYLKRHGKDALLAQITASLKHMLESNPTGCIIECGLASLAGEDALNVLRAYSQTHPVIWIRREREHHLSILQEIMSQSDAEEALVYDVLHRTCSNFEYFNLFDESCTAPSLPASGVNTPSESRQVSYARLLAAREDFARFLDHLTQRAFVARAWQESPFALDAIPPEFRAYSYALRLRLSSLITLDHPWEDFEARGDCVELIIDTWPQDLWTTVSKQVALIRRHMPVPIIYHVEEYPRHEAKRQNKDERNKLDAQLYELGLRLGVDYVSVDLQRDDDFVHGVLRHRGMSKVIGNFWHLGTTAPPWDDDSHVSNYKRAQNLGCYVVRMARFCVNTPAEALEEFKEKIQNHDEIPDPKPRLVAFDFSTLGIRLPLQSRILSPVKHPHINNDREWLATTCTYSTSFELLFRQFLLEPLRFYVLGANVSYSLSPAMHAAAYHHSGMLHTFEARSCSMLEDLNNILPRDHFGGASLTAPFKVAIMPHLASKSSHATAIGAVNVVLPLRGPSSNSSLLLHANARNRSGPSNGFHGENTDWTSIMTCLKRALSPRNAVKSTSTAVVVGAGGMARAAVYALLQLGCRHIFIYNRTVHRAEELAAHFNKWQAESEQSHKDRPDGVQQPPERVCKVLPSLTEPWPENHLSPTMVVSCIQATAGGGNPPAEFRMPAQWLGSPTGGVVVELAYEVLVTPLVAQMRNYHHAGGLRWIVIDGLEVVGEMAIGAFELMTGRMAPRRLMKEVSWKTWEAHRRDKSTSMAL